MLVARRDDAADAVTVAGPAAPLTIVPATGPLGAGQVVLPELRGLSGREALRVLARLGITPRVAGEGVVIDQDPAARHARSSRAAPAAWRSAVRHAGSRP